jgi:hypothetical protein
VSYIGSWAIDDLLTFVTVTQVFSTGVATDADSAPAYRVYEDETTTPILTGTMALLDSANTAGLYSEQITLSAANGFEKGKSYSIYISATVSSVAGATWRSFQIQAAVDTKSINAVAATSVTTINANLGQTQPVNFTGTAGSALVKADMVDIAGATVSTSTAQIGVNTVNLGGTSQTGRDIGASVLLSSGSSTGQLDFTSGVVKVNLVQILGTVLTETAGLLAGGFKKFFNVATPTGTLNSIPDAVAGAAGGLFIAGSNAATTVNITGNITGNLSGSVGSVTARVTANTDQLAGQTVTAAAGVTFPTSVASPTNITAGTITTVTNLTNAPTVGDFTTVMKTSLGTASSDALATDTYAEPSGVPAATATLADKLGWLAFLARNRIEETATTQVVKADDGTTTVGTAAVSDDGTTFVRDEWA